MFIFVKGFKGEKHSTLSKILENQRSIVHGKEEPDGIIEKEIGKVSIKHNRPENQCMDVMQ